MRDVEQQQFSPDAQFAIQLALHEALTNAIVHGGRGADSDRITIQSRVDGYEARITISDEGPGFDPATVPDPTSEQNLMKPHGRGIMLMRAYVDAVIYDRAGTRVTLIKANSGPLSRKARSHHRVRRRGR